MNITPYDFSVYNFSCLPDGFCALDIRPPFLWNLLFMKGSGGTDDLASGNESGTEEKTSDHGVRAGEKDGAENSKSKNSSSNPKKIGRRIVCYIQETLNIDNRSDHESDASAKSKHSRKRIRVSKRIVKLPLTKRETLTKKGL